jgi:hypothetical protein
MEVIPPTDEVITGGFLPLRMMGARLGWLDQSWPVFLQTGLPLIGERNGLLAPIPVGDDIGLYIIAPAAARYLGLSLHDTLSLLLVAFAAIGALLAIGQLWAAFKDWPTRLYAAAAVIASMASILFGAGDIYALTASAVLALLPLCVLIARRIAPMSLMWLPLTVLAGGVGQASNLIRSHSGTGPLIAIVLVVLAHRATAFRTRALLAAGIVFGFVAIAYLGTLPVTARDAYLMAQRGDYRPILPAHPFWHSVYIGFGFLSNPLGLEYRDDVAAEAGRRINPALDVPVAEEWQYNVQGYDLALRQATLDFVKAHAFFAIKTIFAKLGVLQLFVLLFANLGLLGVKPLVALPRLSIPLGFALALAAMPGIMVQPNFNYLSPFVATVTVIAAIGLGLVRDRNKNHGTGYRAVLFRSPQS